MSESRPQFDSQLGGAVEVPIELNVMNFSSARAQEIAALTMAIDDPQRSGLIFQKLPRHMRRRVMSHNAKRMPRRLREAHAQQLARTGPQSSRKRPSRKYRRRPANLLEEYNRRQRSYVWLETHIWHAKRFHMTERWGYRLAHFPNDRSYRACYRATANHCLLQDVSFLCCVELNGPQQALLTGLMQHADSRVGLTFSAQSLLDGKREGEVMFYESQCYPHGAIGTVNFLWKPLKTEDSNELRTVWLWIHPSYHQKVLSALTNTFSFSSVCGDSKNDTPMDIDNSDATTTAHPAPSKKKKIEDKKSLSVEGLKLATRNVPFRRTPKYVSKCGNVEMVLLKDTLNRFRLTGPLSHSVLQECLCVVSEKHLSTKMDVDESGCTGEKTPPPTPHIEEENNITGISTAAIDIDTIFSTAKKINKKTDSADSNVLKKDSITVDKSNGSNEDERHCTDWIETDLNGYLAHRGLWSSFSGALSPAQMLPHLVLSLVVSDPRSQIPDKRTKAVPKAGVVWKPTCNTSSVNLTSYCGPIWYPEIRDKVTTSKLSTAEINMLRSKRLVPGLVRRENGQKGGGDNEDIESASESNQEMIKPLCQEDQSLPGENPAKVPIMLIQRPGSQDPNEKRLGFGCGWDVILPAGWAMPFWLAFIFRGARPGGLREAESHLLESGKSQFLPPDTLAGQQEEEHMEKELRDKYFRLPPDKRPNFIKLGVACPFRCAWNLLLRDWAPLSDSGFLTNAPMFVLRDRKLLLQLSDTLQGIWKKLIKSSKDQNPEVRSDTFLSILKSVPSGSTCLIPVKVKAFRRGVTDDKSLICIPTQDDIMHLTGSSNIDPSEIVFEDPAHEKRSKLRSEHKKLLTRLRRRRVRAKRKLEDEEADSDSEKEDGKETENPKHLPISSRVSEGHDPPTKSIVNSHREEMETLWLPDLTPVGSVRKSGTRETAGFVTKGDYSFTEARGCGVGYLAFNSFSSLIEEWWKFTNRNGMAKLPNRNPIVLVRSPSSFQYRPANLIILC